MRLTLGYHELVERAYDVMILSERARIVPAFGPVGLVPEVVDMTWEQAIAMEEFSEPMCFTTELFLGGIERLAAQARDQMIDGTAASAGAVWSRVPFDPDKFPHPHDRDGRAGACPAQSGTSSRTPERTPGCGTFSGPTGRPRPDASRADADSHVPDPQITPRPRPSGQPRTT